MSSKSIRDQAKTKANNARRDLRHWVGKSHTATDAKSAATFRRGVEDAQRRLSEAESTLNRLPR